MNVLPPYPSYVDLYVHPTKNKSNLNFFLRCWASHEQGIAFKNRACQIVRNAFEKKERKLDFSAYNLKDFPLCMDFLPDIEECDFKNNFFKSVDVISGWKLKYLDLSNNPLDEFPAVIYTQLEMQSLILHNIFISTPLPGAISPQISALAHLQLLCLSGNKLREIPNAIFSLTSLEKLCLEDNELISIPKEINNLSNLRDLRLAGNQLSSLPNKIFLLPLKIINLSRNLFEVLPSTLSQAKDLTHLIIYSNRISSIPNWQQLPKTLVILDLFNNALKYTDTDLINLVFLRFKKVEVFLGDEIFSEEQQGLSVDSFEEITI